MFLGKVCEAGRITKETEGGKKHTGDLETHIVNRTFHAKVNSLCCVRLFAIP